MENRRRFILVSAILLMLCLIPSMLFAAEKIDLNTKCTLTVSYQDGAMPLVGTTFDVYQIGDMHEDGTFVIKDKFSFYPVDLTAKNTDAWRDAAGALKGYILRDNISPEWTAFTGADGFATFDNLPCGLYMVIGHRHVQEDIAYESEPFLLTLPNYDETTKEWKYQIIASQKKVSEPLPEGQPEDETTAYKVLKVWKDAKGDSRPKFVEVQLLKDGKPYSKVTLSKTNQWQYVWEKLPTQHSWTVVEKEPKGYTVSVRQEGKTFVITNTKDKSNETGDKEDGEDTETPMPTPDGDSNDKLPLTGQLWPVALLLFTFGLVFVLIGLLFKRRNDYES